MTSVGPAPEEKAAGTVVPPPSSEQNGLVKDQKQAEFVSAPTIDEVAVRKALLDYASDQCCWGKGAARDMKIEKLEPSTSYHYILETFTEGRRIVLDHVPHSTNKVDGPENGQPPGPWEMHARTPTMFEDDSSEIAIPHTHYVKSCHTCGASGKVECFVCRGSGHVKCNGGCSGKGEKKVYRNSAWVMERCSRCSGRGEISCSSCGSSGRRTCTSCNGHLQLLWFQKLIISWRNNRAEHVVEKTSLPPEMVAHASGSIGFEDLQQQVIPLQRFPEPEINSASQRLLGGHKFPDRRILMQRHKIRIIAVTKCICKYKNKDMTYYVFGLDNDVHAPDYPQQSCFGFINCPKCSLDCCPEEIREDLREECSIL
ncbi:protein SSUH2 homolog [Mytilus galloprovincialis]|uniref:protein SSUH2 homolog n=1 Tax=Mytilus galloprovincialis TaxID=29158 RepID=UPI003F7BE28E